MRSDSGNPSGSIFLWDQPVGVTCEELSGDRGQIRSESLGFPSQRPPGQCAQIFGAGTPEWASSSDVGRVEGVDGNMAWAIGALPGGDRELVPGTNFLADVTADGPAAAWEGVASRVCGFFDVPCGQAAQGVDDLGRNDCFGRAGFQTQCARAARGSHASWLGARVDQHHISDEAADEGPGAQTL